MSPVSKPKKVVKQKKPLPRKRDIKKRKRKKPMPDPEKNKQPIPDPTPQTPPVSAPNPLTAKSPSVAGVGVVPPVDPKTPASKANVAAANAEVGGPELLQFAPMSIFGKRGSSGIDFRDVISGNGLSMDSPGTSDILREVNKVNAISGLLKFLGINPGDLLKQLIAAIFKRMSETAPPTPPVVTVPPVVPQPGPAPVPGPTPVPPITAPERVITSFHLKPFWFQHKNTDNVEPKSVLDAIVNRSEPLVEQNRLAIDCDILDQFGVEIFIRAGSQQDLDELWHPKDDPDSERADTHRMRWFFEGGDGIAEVHESGNGFVPKIKIPKGALKDKEKGKDYETGQLYGVFTRRAYTDANGKVVPEKKIETPRFPSLRIKK